MLHGPITAFCAVLPRTARNHCPPADKQLDTAATVLRMLYIKDLRKLQTQIDEMIVQVQVSESQLSECASCNRTLIGLICERHANAGIKWAVSACLAPFAHM